MKFRVSSEEESEVIQKILFEMGYKWTICAPEEAMFLTKPFLYANSDGLLGYGSNLDMFLQYQHQEHCINYNPMLVPKITKTITIAGKKYDEELVKYWLENNSVPCVDEDDE